MRVSIFDPITLAQGTIFVMSNCNDLLTKSLYDPNIQVSPSAFACLNLPAWANTAGNEQTFYVNPTTFGSSNVIVDANILVPALLQNNLDNLSLYATAEMTNENLTFVESAFWKLLQSTHTFKPIQTNELYKQDAMWNPLVTYIGTTLDLGTTTINGVNYTEAFLYIPLSAKPVNAKWKTVQYAGIDNAARFPKEGYVENALGLKTGDAAFVKAIYDIDDKQIEQQYYSIAKGSDKLQLQFDNVETYDGDIEFNAIAIYCDVWHLDKPSEKTRCLHSIYFVNKFEASAIAGTYAIPTFIKKQQTEDGSATSLAFRICSRMSSCNAKTMPIEVTAIDGISLDMYMQTLQEMSNQSQLLEQLKNQVATLNEQMQSLIFGIGINGDAMEQVNLLRQTIEQQGIYVAPNDLLDMFIEVSNAMKSAEKQVVVNINVQQK